ncbi:MAG: aspartate--tRNA(Asn) ligase [Deltaproteobacteria bacterium]|nr:MAG: aspartate--tRNA(Asn) ligase [Deltaproteobacteria bacterium]TMQ13439.1 MAG: aspartate--tRNA(Asn) ligase [Deltaproteobacteria bacterium]
MERIGSVEVAARVGQRVRVVGWLQSLRRLGAISFLVVRDGRGVVQAVADQARLAPLAGLEAESVIAVTGEVCAESQAPGGVELRDVALEVLAGATEPPPVLLGKKLANVALPALLDHAVVANRFPSRRAVFRIAAAAMRGFRAALDTEQFVEIQSPKLVEAATEGGANVFAVDYFGRPAYLAQSPQLYKQIMVGVFERVYEVGPVFRAEPHDTARHINQYTSLDVELGFVTDHFDVMAQLARVLRGMLAEIAATCAPELALLGARLPGLPETIPHLHFTEAVDRLAAPLGEAVRDEPDLSPAGERWLGQWAHEQHGSDWLFVTGYPMRKRPFYTHPDPERPAHSRSFDLLFRGTELVTGGQRLHRHADYLAALAARGMSPDPIAAYLEAFRHGMPPHGGFAIGLERFVMQLLDLPNIRLATLFPRDLARLSP